MCIGPLRLVRFLGTAKVARRLLLLTVGVVLPRLLLRVDLVLLAELLVVSRVPGPGAFLTAPRRFCVPCDSPLVGDWHPTSPCLGSGTCGACMACLALPRV